jgi:hypothetical protein
MIEHQYQLSLSSIYSLTTSLSLSPPPLLMYFIVINTSRDIIKMPFEVYEEFLFTKEVGVPLGLMKHPLTLKTLVYSHLLPCPPFTNALNERLSREDTSIVIGIGAAEAAAAAAGGSISSTGALVDEAHLSKKQLLKLKQDKLKREAKLKASVMKEKNAKKKKHLKSALVEEVTADDATTTNATTDDDGDGQVLANAVKRNTNTNHLDCEGIQFHGGLVLPVIGSEIVEINDVPISCLTHEQVLHRLATSSFPLSIHCVFKRNYDPSHVLTKLSHLKNAATLFLVKTIHIHRERETHIFLFLFFFCSFLSFCMCESIFIVMFPFSFTPYYFVSIKKTNKT